MGIQKPANEVADEILHDQWPEHDEALFKLAAAAFLHS